jgi:hypothetical protein
MNDDSRTRGRTVQLVGHVADFIDHSFQPASEFGKDLRASRPAGRRVEDHP